jgi:hypothetical protein
MMILARPEFKPRSILDAFDIRTLAGLGETISSSVSRPDVLAAAEAELASQGITAECHEEVYQLPEGPATYSRLCVPTGDDAIDSGVMLSADVIARDSAQAQWWQDLQAKRLADELAMYDAKTDPYVDPNFRPAQITQAQQQAAAQQQAVFEQQAREALRVSAPVVYENWAKAVTPERQMATGNGSAADRQPGTMNIQPDGPAVDSNGGGLFGMDTTTLLLVGLGAAGLVWAMNKKG